jgi:hypothetical protein
MDRVNPVIGFDTERCHKKCPCCNAGPGALSLLNPQGEEKGGIVNYSYRCEACHRYFREYQINKDLKIWGGA